MIRIDGKRENPFCPIRDNLDESRAAVKSSHFKSHWRVIGWETEFNDWKDRIQGTISTSDFFKEHKMYEPPAIYLFIFHQLCQNMEIAFYRICVCTKCPNHKRHLDLRFKIFLHAVGYIVTYWQNRIHFVTH